MPHMENPAALAGADRAGIRQARPLLNAPEIIKTQEADYQTSPHPAIAAARFVERRHLVSPAVAKIAVEALGLWLVEAGQ
jgi:hypothetical protein